MRPVHQDRTVQTVESQPRVAPVPRKFQCVDGSALNGHVFELEHQDRRHVMLRRQPDLHKLYSFTTAEFEASFLEVEPWA